MLLPRSTSLLLVVCCGFLAPPAWAQPTAVVSPFPPYPRDGRIPPELDENMVFVDTATGDLVIVWSEPGGEREISRITPSTHVDPRISVTIRREGAERYRYDYTVTNLAGARQAIARWFLAIPQPRSANPFDPSDVAFPRDLSGAWDFVHYGHRPGLWSVMWTARRSASHLAPGTVDSRFSIEGDRRPGFVEAYFQGPEENAGELVVVFPAGMDEGREREDGSGGRLVERVLLSIAVRPSMVVELGAGENGRVAYRYIVGNRPGARQVIAHCVLGLPTLEGVVKIVHPAGWGSNLWKQPAEGVDDKLSVMNLVKGSRPLEAADLVRNQAKWWVRSDAAPVPPGDTRGPFVIEAYLLPGIVRMYFQGGPYRPEIPSTIPRMLGDLIPAYNFIETNSVSMPVIGPAFDVETRIEQRLAAFTESIERLAEEGALDGGSPFLAELSVLWRRIPPATIGDVSASQWPRLCGGSSVATARSFSSTSRSAIGPTGSARHVTWPGLTRSIAQTARANPTAQHGSIITPVGTDPRPCSRHREVPQRLKARSVRRRPSGAVGRGALAKVSAMERNDPALRW